MSVEHLPASPLPAARKIARSLGRSETSLDASIIAHAELVGSIAQGRIDTKSPMQVGHAALLTAIEAMSALGRAADLTVTCHQHLAATRDQFRMDESQAGCNPGKYQEPKASRTAAAA